MKTKLTNNKKLNSLLPEIEICMDEQINKIISVNPFNPCHQCSIVFYA